MAPSAPKSEAPRIIVGVDTHKHTHAAVAVDEPRSRLGECHVQANRGGYAQLEAWALSLDRPTAFGAGGDRQLRRGAGELAAPQRPPAGRTGPRRPPLTPNQRQD